MGSLTPVFGQRLTNREKEIVQYIALGMRTTQIAEHLGISEYTVFNHRKNVIRKKGVRSVREVVKPKT
jgi:DNA-binding CsgD family transcriptional regulator